jgi:hypothetical protein
VEAPEWEKAATVAREAETIKSPRGDKVELAREEEEDSLAR